MEPTRRPLRGAGQTKLGGSTLLFFTLCASGGVGSKIGLANDTLVQHSSTISLNTVWSKACSCSVTCSASLIKSATPREADAGDIHRPMFICIPGWLSSAMSKPSVKSQIFWKMSTAPCSQKMSSSWNTLAAPRRAKCAAVSNLAYATDAATFPCSAASTTWKPIAHKSLAQVGSVSTATTTALERPVRCIWTCQSATESP
mmetsp:Transcript_19339/g.43992  ORF Transcript_19339/g.43992 Transcript_19339/m.43992 type:complete len:201 (-) Transcript_19339:432-1034(-)